MNDGFIPLVTIMDRSTPRRGKRLAVYRGGA